MTLEKFADEHRLVMQVNERERQDLPRFWAKLGDVEVVDGCMLRGAFGNGGTPNDAITDYCNEISTKRLKIRNKEYVNAPKLTYKPK